jgi:hypothetical protein
MKDRKHEKQLFTLKKQKIWASNELIIMLILTVKLNVMKQSASVEVNS